MNHKSLNKNLINLKDWEYEFTQRAEQPILLCDWWMRGIGGFFAAELDIKIPYFDYIFTDSNRGYCKPFKKQAVLQAIREKIKDPKSLKRILKRSVDFPRDFNDYSKVVNQAIRKPNISNQELAKLLETMDDKFIRNIPWFWYPYYMASENMLIDPVKMRIQEHKSKIEKILPLDEAILLLIFPVKKTAFQIEQEEMHKLVKLAHGKNNFEKSPAFKKAGAAYLKKYDWLTTFILSPLLPMTYKQLAERVRDAIKNKFAETYPKQVAEAQSNATKVKLLWKLIQHDRPLTQAIENARELGYGLTAGIEEAYVSSSRYLKFLQIVAERIGVKYEDTKYLVTAEEIEALKTGKKISSKIIEERRKGFIAGIIEGQQYFSFGKEAHKLSQWVDLELNKVDQSIKELKGQPACKGFVKGKVRIALNPEQAHAIKEGEVLVCPMTNPDYVPAMKRSSAIVTDEGGLLSHAAIMSREFNKPCVIGTKIATKLLKNGDMVEVDANKGIIRIIK
jgi:phosphoenolpyruvate synthase/pyruvate phosphate dikinase